MKYLFFFSILIFSFTQCFGQKGIFTLPLHGQQGIDYFIDNYPDHDTSSGIRDPYCGTKTYNGHRGTDFSLRSFKTMDSGINVYAMADGVIFSRRDGEYDRNKHWIAGKRANYICILHANEYFVYYNHLKKGSLLVKRGDTVKQGQIIAQVGSSGFSSGPHLDIEVKSNKYPFIDPFSNPCRGLIFSLWLNEPAYDTGLYLIDAGFIPYTPNIDTLRERYMVKDTFCAPADDTVCFWAQMHGLRKGYRIHAEWYGPSSLLWETFNYTWPLSTWNDYSWTYMSLPDKPGKWEIHYFVNEQLITTRSFYILPRKHEFH